MLRYSVIVPAWNAEDSLPLCLSALEQQTLPKEQYEIIVVDDGSSDRTREVACGFAIQYHFQDNAGPAMARNQGVDLAKGELVLFTDADCVPDPDWLEAMTVPFSNPEIAAVKGAYRTEQKSLVARFAQLEFEERFDMLRKKDSIDMVDTYSAAFRKDIFQELGGFDTSFPEPNNEDTEFSYRMAGHGYRMVFAPDAVVRHLNHPDAVVRYFRLKFSRGFWRMMVYRMFPGKMMADSYTPQSLKAQIMVLFLIETSLLLFFVDPLFAGGLLFFGIVIFFLLSLSFVQTAWKKDRHVAVLSPLFLALRAGAIGSGALWGLLRICSGYVLKEKRDG